MAESDRSWSEVRTLLREALALDVEVARCLPAPAEVFRHHLEIRTCQLPSR